MSGRVLALDYGQAHTGVAVSDPTGTIARPLGDIGEAGSPAGINAVAAMVKEHGAALVIVGLPVSLSGRKGEQAMETEFFIARLRQALKVPVVTVDERFTTSIASQRSRHARGSIHSLAACCLLETYLGSAAGSR